MSGVCSNGRREYREDRERREVKLDEGKKAGRKGTRILFIVAAAALCVVLTASLIVGALVLSGPPGQGRTAGDSQAGRAGNVQAGRDGGTTQAGGMSGDGAAVQTGGDTGPVRQSDSEGTEIELPARYDLRESGTLPESADQGALSTCWAFASLSALQSSMPDELRTPLSVDHMTMHNSFGCTLDDGGTSAMSTAYLLAWQGPAAEADDPYGDGVSPAGLTPVCHVQEIQYLQPKSYEDIKRYVMEYGGVESSLYFPQGEGVSRDDFYRAETNSFYYNGDEGPNHAVVIVGWDDEYPRENFAVKPENDGAFLCQNSWGESFGEDGLFYVSYEDTGIGAETVCYTGVEPADNYDKIYQTDLCGWTGNMGYGTASASAWFANVYTCEGWERIEAAGLYATQPRTFCKIFGGVMQEEDKDGTEAALGKLLKDKYLLATAEFDEAGFYTLPFGEGFPVWEGERFALIVEISSIYTGEPVAVEGRMTEWTENVDISDGEGYISNDAAVWERVETKYDCNLCLKAYSRERIINTQK